MADYPVLDGNSVVIIHAAQGPVTVYPVRSAAGIVVIIAEQGPQTAYPVRNKAGDVVVEFAYDPAYVPPNGTGVDVQLSPSYDSSLGVGATLASARVTGVYGDLNGQSVTEATLSLEVGGTPRTPSYIPTVADIGATVTEVVELLVGGASAVPPITLNINRVIPSIVINMTSSPSYNAGLIVGQTLNSARVAGTYDNVGAYVVTEVTASLTVGGVAQSGTYVPVLADVGAEVQEVIELWVGGLRPDTPATITLTYNLPAVVVNETTPSSFDAPVFKVGARIIDAYLPGTRNSPSGVVSEDIGAAVFTLGDTTEVSGTHVIGVGEGPISGRVPLLLDATPGLADATISPTPVTNTKPTAGNVPTANLQVPAGPAVTTGPFTTNATYFRSTDNVPTTDGKFTFMIDAAVSDAVNTPYLAEMDNSHIRCLVVDSNKSIFLNIKDSGNTVVFASQSVATLVLNQRFQLIVSMNLATGELVTSFKADADGVAAPVVVTRTLTTGGATTGILASAGRKFNFLARSGASAPVAGVITALKVWNEYVAAGGVPADDDPLLLTDGKIFGPAGVANVHPWKLGGDAT